jgi:hypothetical protein
VINSLVSFRRYLVDGEYSFEIGGREKGQKQVSGLNSACIVKDGIESGGGNVLPIWMFGLLY